VSRARVRRIEKGKMKEGAKERIIMGVGSVEAVVRFTLRNDLRSVVERSRG
jgi:hypothetical protein